MAGSLHFVYFVCGFFSRSLLHLEQWAFRWWFIVLHELHRQLLPNTIPLFHDDFATGSSLPVSSIVRPCEVMRETVDVFWIDARGVDDTLNV